MSLSLVSIYLELVAVGTGKAARYGACAILTCGERVKAAGQYLGIHPSRAGATGAATRLALDALTRPCAVWVYSNTVVRSQKQKSLFDRPGVEWVYISPGSYYRERAAYWAAYEIALGGEVTDAILELAVKAEDASRKLIAC